MKTRGRAVSRWQEHREMAADSLARLWRQGLGTLMTISVIGIALLLPALLLTGISFLSGLSGDLQGSARISAYLTEDVDQSQRQRLLETLGGDPAIRELRYISPAQAADEFARLSGLGDVIAALPANPLPATVEIIPAATGEERVRSLAERLRALPETETVQLDLAWVQRLDALLELGRRLALTLAAIIAVAVLFIVGNTIRLAIGHRRDEIRVMKLLGAPDSFVARPFLYTGAWCGLGGGLLGSALLLLIYLLVSGPIGDLLLQMDSPPGETVGLPTLVTGLLVGSTVLGWGGALLSVRRHLGSL